MLRVIKQQLSGLKHPLYASLTLSFLSFGDAFLYPFLPQYADVMKVPVVWIGVLLSINRFIRILINPFIVRLFAKYGIRTVTIAAAVMAIISTAGYSLGWGLISLLIFRIIWGSAYAVLRISTLAYTFEHEHTGISMGVSKAIQAAGPLLALATGPVLLSYFSPFDTFFVLALASMPGLIYAVALPELHYIPSSRKAVLGLPSLNNSITFLLSFFIDGMLVITAGVLLTDTNISLSTLELTGITAGYLAYRRICFIFFAPLSGLMAQRIGFLNVFNGSLFMISIGLVLLVTGFIPAALIIIFTFNSINTTIAPGAASCGEIDKIKAVARNANWWDIGAAAGALTGGLLLPGGYLMEIFTIATFVILLLSIVRIAKIKP